MKPGARPHWGMKICPGRAPRGKLGGSSGGVDVFGQVEVTGARAECRLAPRPDCNGRTRPRSRFGSPRRLLPTPGAVHVEQHGFHTG